MTSSLELPRPVVCQITGTRHGPTAVSVDDDSSPGRNRARSGRHLLLLNAFDVVAAAGRQPEQEGPRVRRVQQDAERDGDGADREDEQQETIDDDRHLLPFDLVDESAVVCVPPNVASVDRVAQFVQSPTEAPFQPDRQATRGGWIPPADSGAIV